MTAANRNLLWAEVLADELVRHGVRHAVTSPGSRSAPLLFALASHDALETHVVIDERSAGFLALGISKATGEPAAVVTTSGTAAANLLPAAIEAQASATPLVLVTADRPAALRGTDANQTLDQRELFGRSAKGFLDLPLPHGGQAGLAQLCDDLHACLHAALTTPHGPVHLNVPFDAPLEPSSADDGVEHVHWRRRSSPRAAAPPPALPAGLPTLAERLETAERVLVVAGPDATGASGRAGLDLAGRLDAPLAADPLSGARCGHGADASLAHFDLFLRDPATNAELRADLVVQVGPAPTSKALVGWMAGPKAPERWVLGIGPRSPWPAVPPERFLRGDVEAMVAALLADLAARPTKAWHARWRELDQRARSAVEGTLGDGLSEPNVARTTLASLPDGSCLFVGNSAPVRDVDAYAGVTQRDVRVLGNRGVSGIDGLVSTALGAHLGSGRPVVALLGDLSLLHDVGGLLAARAAEAITFVVVHNDGGGIFHRLPVAGYDPIFTSHVATPHGLSFGPVADLYGLAYHEPGSLDELGERIAKAGDPGRRLVVVRADRRETQAIHQRIEQAITIQGGDT